MQLNTYLNFDGNCAEAFRLYEKVLGGRIEMMETHGDSPARDHVPPARHDAIMHARLAVGDHLLMGSDTPPDHFAKPQGFHLSVNVATPEEADRVFSALAQGGKVEMPLQATFWSVRFGMLVDRFGTPWMVNCDQKP